MTGVPAPWQQAQWRRLHQQRDSDQLPHALLLTGQAGLGLDDFARRFAQSLLCSAPTVEGPCGQCADCRQFAAGVHPDYQYLTLEENKKQIVVDQVRQLNAFALLTSRGDGRKVVVVSPADRMNVNAANSLLKTLEEPPGRVVMILVAHHLHLLPATIKSRCQQVKFVVPERAVAAAWLQQRGHQQPEALLQLAQGAPCLAERMDDEALQARYAAVMEESLALMQGVRTPGELRAAWQSCEIDWLVKWSLSLLRDCIRCASRLPDGRFENPGWSKALQAAVSRVNFRQLFVVHDHLLDLDNQLDHPLNKDLLLDDVLLSWQSLSPGG